MQRALCVLSVVLTIAIATTSLALSRPPVVILAAVPDAPAAGAGTLGYARLGLPSVSAVVPPAGPVASDLAALEDEVIRLTNLERAKLGLWPLQKNPILTGTARAHIQDMIDNDFVSHKGSNGFSSAQRALAAGYAPYGWGGTYVGENLAGGLNTPEEAVRGWLNSPTHRANLLRPEFREIGVGVALGGRYRIYWAQNFGSAPKVFPAYVEGGASDVNDPRVTLTITRETVSVWGSIGPAVSMMVTNESPGTGAWQPYSPTLPWTLTAEPGRKTVHVHLRDAEGSVASTQVEVELRPTVADAS